jgi:hypothetical protein
MAYSLQDIIEDAYVNGKYCYSSFRKVSATAATAGFWADLSMTTGNPVPNYYVGAELTATIPTNWYKKGLWHGGSVAPDQKRLHKICMMSTGGAAAPAPFILCDYLMYYPLIDMDSMDDQLFTNYGPTVTDTTDPTAAALPRYTDGVGVKAFLVATNPYVGGQAFYITYTNSAGETGRKSKLTVTNTGSNIGTIVSAHTAGVQQYGVFIELQQGDIGIRKVDAITFLGSNGGLAALVLCRPIANMMTRETTAWAEFDFISMKPSMPRIYDGAYLNFLAMPSATIAAIPIIGEITTIWGT